MTRQILLDINASNFEIFLKFIETLDYVKVNNSDFEKKERLTEDELLQLVEFSSNEAKKGNIVSHKDVKKEIDSWKK